MVQKNCLWITFEYISTQCFIIEWKNNSTKIDITSFREILIENLLGKDEEIPTENLHKLEETKSRGRCTSCYKNMVAQGGRMQAQKIKRQIKTKRASCMKMYGVPCFGGEHKIDKKKINNFTIILF